MMESNLVDLTASSTKELLQTVESKPKSDADAVLHNGDNNNDSAASSKKEPTEQKDKKETNSSKEIRSNTKQHHQQPIGPKKQANQHQQQQFNAKRGGGVNKYHFGGKMAGAGSMPPLPPAFYPATSTYADFMSSPFAAAAAAAASQYFLASPAAALQFAAAAGGGAAGQAANGAGSSSAATAAAAAAAAAASSYFFSASFDHQVTATSSASVPPTAVYKNHRTYVQAKQAQNMHKLWPHSVKKNHQQQQPHHHSQLRHVQNQRKPANGAKSARESGKTLSMIETLPVVTSTNGDHDKGENAASQQQKTPMCLINELTKHNKIKHEYVLLDEMGPAHKKVFYVVLKLNVGAETEETYNGHGTSIKKAQHAAAENALKQTKFKIPPVRAKKRNSIDETVPISAAAALPNELAKRLFKNAAEEKAHRPNPALAPTVLLNSLAMKLGLVANYQHTNTNTHSESPIKPKPESKTTSETTKSEIEPIKEDKQPVEESVKEKDVEVKNPPIKEEEEAQKTEDEPAKGSEETKTDSKETLKEASKEEEKPEKATNDEKEKETTPKKEEADKSESPKPNPLDWLKSKPFKPSPAVVAAIEAAAAGGVQMRPQSGRFNNRYNKSHRFTADPTLLHNYSSYPYFNYQPVHQPVYNVKLRFAGEDFDGTGATLQLAKHNAASRALEHFSNTDNFLKAKSLAESTHNKTIKAYRPPQFLLNAASTSANQGGKSNGGDNVNNTNKANTTTTKSTNGQVQILKKSKTPSENNNQESSVDTTAETKNVVQEKSEINILHEFAIRLKKTVAFELIHESGPPHAKTFRVKCSFGTKPAVTETATEEQPEGSKETTTYFEVTGEGRSKKAANKEAAKSMIKIIEEKFEALLNLGSGNGQATKKKRSSNKEAANKTATAKTDNSNGTSRRPRAANIVKMKKTSPEYGKGSINPISRLIQIQQAKSEPEPVFELLSSTNKASSANNAPLKRPGNNEHGGRRTEFVMQVTLKSGNDVLKCEGKGVTKKAAKQNAAEAMLSKLGYQPRVNLKPVLKNPPPTVTNDPQPTATPTLAEISTAVSITVVAESTTQDADDKTEKRVKFVQEDLVVTLDPAPQSATKTSDSSSGSPMTKKKSAAPNEKLRVYKQQLLSQGASSEKYNTYLNKEALETVYKIASELLESIGNEKEKREGEKEFHSATAESILKSSGGQMLPEKEDKDEDEKDESGEKEATVSSAQLKLLTGADCNYKKALQYISQVMNFKLAYQSLKMRDGSVNTAVTISILPETDRALRGQGSSHVESSNAAALSALQYLASKLNSK